MTNEILSEKEIKKEVKKKLDEKGTIKRVSSGVPGLDEAMEMGFKENSVTLIGGGAGSGKSIFCMQFLLEGVKNNENGLYISFEENKEKILENFKNFNWELDDAIKKDKITILYYTPEQVAKVLESGSGVIYDIIESKNIKRLVFDSLTALSLLFKNELEKRKYTLKLIDAIKKWDTTALLTAEEEPDPDKHESTVMEFETDSVILLYNTRKGDIRERSIEVFKMRGSRHAARIFPMKITSTGIVIYPDESVF